jgi:hypothetical protein
VFTARYGLSVNEIIFLSLTFNVSHGAFCSEVNSDGALIHIMLKQFLRLKIHKQYKCYNFMSSDFGYKSWPSVLNKTKQVILLV